MGHTEKFQFVDPRDGEYGVAYTAPTEAELRKIIAEKFGYAGNLHFSKIITAYPPRPYGRVECCPGDDSEADISF
ncbi:hypothetical protein N032_27925 (plasmid) [Pseudomonas syringae pv. pisi str. PP1]|uniref:hypothetical protein n=1 Tax=Pseudomonas syringae TaxID=317 RepID=UPI000F5BAF50|nr:hypothetical protein [Pseudomonas syringae]AZG89382.1 hypothetical protein N032_27925 [Pseudomonas syringae pv. pisi str. PP1]